MSYMKYVNEIIGNEYEAWGPGKKIIISSGTGSGKTSFVFNELLGQAIKLKKQGEKKYKIVYICNRKAIKEQVLQICLHNNKIEISDYLYIVTYQYCETIGEFPDINITYKNLKPDEKEYYNSSKKNIEINKDEVLYYIFDEAHYFVSDASFNNNVSFWYSANIKLDNNISIYLTATPEPLVLFLENIFQQTHLWGFLEEIDLSDNRIIELKENIAYLYENLSNYNSHHYNNYYDTDLEKFYKELEKLMNTKETIAIAQQIIKYFPKIINKFYSNKECSDIITYKQEKDYSNYTVFNFYEYEELFQNIINNFEDTAFKDKWVIFVDNEKDGEILKEKLNLLWRTKNNIFKRDEQYITPFAAFISAEILNQKKGTAVTVHKQLMKDQRFDNKVLIATSVIDCGINIIDDSVNHIVISQSNKTVFIQMLGRLRITENNDKKRKINLYIKHIKVQSIRMQYEQAVKDLNIAKLFHYANRIDNVANVFKNQILNKEFSNILIKTTTRNNFYDHSITIPDSFKINPALFLYDLYTLYLYNDFIQSKDKDKNYLTNQLSWMDKTINDVKWVNHSTIHEEFETLLNKMKQVELISERRKEFQLKFTKISIKLPPELWPQSIKNDRSRYLSGERKSMSLKNIIKMIQHLNLPYEIIEFQCKKERKKGCKIIEK